MIVLRGICKSYGALQVLRDVNLEIEPRRVTAIVGPSGAGKTTLLQILGTLEKADRGQVLFDGTDVSRLKDKALCAFRNANVGFVFQAHRLLPEFTLRENVALPAMIGGMSAKDAGARAAELLEMLGLKDRMEHKPAQLSGGEAQRGAVARALVNKPGIVLADEPSGSLDTENRETLHQLFFDLRDRLGVTFVIVTHDESLAARADRLVRIRDGRIQ